MNIVVLIGNLTQDPEFRTTNNGKSVVTLNIAVNKEYKREGGPDADFFRIQAWGKTAELANTYLSKGKKVGIQGRIENDNYEKDGVKIYRDTITANHLEFLSPKGETNSSGVSAPAPSDPSDEGLSMENSDFGSFDDDDPLF
jgi:single-strand DNA-binding protein